MVRPIRKWMMTLAFSGALSGVETALSEERMAGSNTLTVSEMVGPMASAEQLFGRLALEDDFREAASLDHSPRRMFVNASGELEEWAGEAFAWANPSFHHKPLYFEQTNLERYGWRSPRCIQPTLSAAHFYGNIVALPIHWFKSPPHQAVFTAGHFRPGTCGLGN